MRYSREEDSICLGADEAVLTALVSTGRSVPAPPLVRRPEGYDGALRATHTVSGVPFLISADGYSWDGRRLSLCFDHPKGAGRLSDAAGRYIRGLGYFLAHLLFCRDGGGEITLSLSLFTSQGDATLLPEEQIDAPRAARFAARVWQALLPRAARLLYTGRVRMPSLVTAPFPYPAVRQGQTELMRRAYAALAAGRTLFASAPTGIGKTVSVLFAALRGMGRGLFEKIFYLTPKNTVSIAAADALRRLHAAGMQAVGVVLSSRAALCPNGLCCLDSEASPCKLSRRAATRCEKACAVLLGAAEAVITPADIRRAAQEYGVCPSTLQQALCTEADVIIGDYNYLFDPDVRMERFFDEAGPCALLVDEAHDLPERVREMMSATVNADLFASAAQAAQEAGAQDAALLCMSTADALRALLLPLTADSRRTDENGTQHGFYSCSEVPAGVPELFSDCVSALQELLPPPGTPAGRRAREAAEPLFRMERRLRLAGRGFVYFVRSTADRFELEVLCLDPSAPIRSCVARGHGTVFFSATLEPMAYYKEVMGADASSDVLVLPSPFERDRLCIAVMQQISSRASQRQERMGDVVAAVTTAIREKPGNYLVFCPSFAYQKALADLFRRRVPKLPLLCQTPDMDRQAREAFLAAFREDNPRALLGLCIMGGIYGEGIDLAGKRLIGCAIVGVGLSALSDRGDATAAYYEDKCEAGQAYAYLYPGFNRVLQAAGRVIRSESDRGVLLLIDDRYADPFYREMMPEHWRGAKFLHTTDELSALLRAFWRRS